MFVSFQKIYTFTRLFSRDFFYYVFSVGDRSKCCIWPKQKIVRQRVKRDNVFLSMFETFGKEKIFEKGQRDNAFC